MLESPYMLKSGVFLTGWSIFSTCCLHQYHFVAQRMKWTEAQTYCRETYTDLVTIENTEDMNQLINTVSSAGNNSQVWIGLYRVIDWKWSDGSGAEYRNWASNQPSLGTDKLGVVIVNSRPSWDIHSCTHEHYFVCYNGTQLDPQFVFVNQPMNWSNAQRYCRENFTDLATVRNNTENQEVMNLPGTYWTWIGLYRDPDINWSDGSAYSFNSWSGSVSGSLMKMMCGVQESNQWTFKSCEERFPFVCYSIPPAPVKRWVVKLRMKVQDSSVDLNDPAVKANILKKFQDRLKEQGVSGVTLKWREQPDGKVFHKEGKEEKKKKLKYGKNRMAADTKQLQAKEEELMKKKQEIRNHLTHLKKERRDLRTAVEAAAGKTHRLLLKNCDTSDAESCSLLVNSASLLRRQQGGQKASPVRGHVLRKTKRPQSSIMMERILLGVLYLSGWSIFSTCHLHQYHFVAQRMKWTEAQTYCRETYTDLATIENTEDMNQLINTVPSASQVWIGLYSNIDWKWSDGYRGSGAEYKNWENLDDNEPDFGGGQFCVNIGNSGRWWDDTCAIEYPFICYNGTQLDPQFVYMSERMTWSNAQRYCRENFIDLATVRNNTENQQIHNLVLTKDWPWIGLYRDPDFFLYNWSDGSPYSLTTWVKRQVVKLRMKVQDSSVDLNDPAVKANILKKASLQNPP
ncbi:macrophage mannose receptor 1-like [Thunnus maccoyii]|uniref:macrophage mannose receptor 1-like n=1 Tax=Thunnus maccoyii TaxID=8240 RepID=UPI001C4AEA07|nr:macrophage mannose receptor 1-like [Thunnus maccoyii]